MQVWGWLSLKELEKVLPGSQALVEKGKGKRARRVVRTARTKAQVCKTMKTLEINGQRALCKSLPSFPPAAGDSKWKASLDWAHHRKPPGNPKLDLPDPLFPTDVGTCSSSPGAVGAKGPTDRERDPHPWKDLLPYSFAV